MERGQFLERMTVITRAGGMALEGLYQSGAGGRPTLVVTGHRALGGTMEAPVPTELCWVLSRAGRPTLRFNWRGVGASAGAPADRALDKEDIGEDLGPYIEDAEAALAHLADTHPGQAVDVVGFSFGAQVARALPAALTGRVVLIAPPADRFPDAAAKSPRASLGGEVCAVVVGAGDPRADRATASSRDEPGRVVVISDADPGFTRGLPALGRCVVEVLEERG